MLQQNAYRGKKAFSLVMKQDKFGGTGWCEESSINTAVESKQPRSYWASRGSKSTSMSFWITFTRQSGQPFINFANQIWSNWGIFHSKLNSCYTSEGCLKRKLSLVVSWGKERDEWVKSQIQTSPQTLVLSAGGIWIYFRQALKR